MEKRLSPFEELVPIHREGQGEGIEKLKKIQTKLYQTMLYDLVTLKNMSNNDETFIIDMLQTFKRTAPPILKRMQEYVSEKKYEAAGREAHKMIPGVSFLGAKKLQEILIQIEVMGKKGIEHEGEFEKPVAEAVEMTNRLIVCFENDFPGKL